VALTDDEIRHLILSRLDSNEWWLLVDVGESELARVIHARHYDSSPEGDFELILGPKLGYYEPAFYLMRKTRMSAAELASCVAEAGGEGLPASSYETRPFLFAPRKTAPSVLVEQFYRWLEEGRRQLAARS
jgi:hypothetical protein